MENLKIVLKSINDDLLLLENVEGFYPIGDSVIVVKFINGSEEYYSNYNVVGYLKEVKK